MKKYRHLLIILLFCFSLPACSYPANAPSTVKRVNFPRYMGRWYEIASFPNWFQKGCRCTMATYSLKKKDVSVLNECIKGDNSTYSRAKGKAWVPDAAEPGRLKVQFFWPFRGNYWILYLQKNYQYVLVGSPRHNYLWILSRRKTMQPAVYNKLIKIARDEGFDVSKIRQTSQQSCPAV